MMINGQKSIAVGGKDYVERIKSLMGATVLGRKSFGTGESYMLREPVIPYGAHFEAKKRNKEPENTYFWDAM